METVVTQVECMRKGNISLATIIGLEKVRIRSSIMNHCTQRNSERGSRDYRDIGHFGCVHAAFR